MTRASVTSERAASYSTIVWRPLMIVTSFAYPPISRSAAAATAQGVIALIAEPSIVAKFAIHLVLALDSGPKIVAQTTPQFVDALPAVQGVGPGIVEGK